jgi:SRSO17 transposase
MMDESSLEDVQSWADELTSLHGRLAGLFKRAEPRQRSLAYLQGLLGAVERKNGWQLAEFIGEATPDGVQHLLERAQWSAEAARDVLRDYVIEHIGTPEGVLIVDETGFIKKGTHSAGVKRQYSGTAGRIENAQVGVFLCYAGEAGSAFIDRELYLPREWCNDRARCEAAGIGQATGFATKPELARRMIERTLDAGVACAWVTGDTVYGGDRSLRVWLESRGLAHVMAVACDEPLWWQAPSCARADEIAQAQPSAAWKRLSAGTGTKGQRLYDWAWVPLWRLQLTPEERRWGHWLLLRRSIEPEPEYAYYVAYAPRDGASLAKLVEIAGQRWQIEAGFEAAKGECGLDHYEVRKYPAWYRHITLALLAHAALAVLRRRKQKKVSRPRDGGLERGRATSAAVAPGLARQGLNRSHPALVRLEAAPPVARQAGSLQAARFRHAGT